MNSDGIIELHATPAAGLNQQMRRNAYLQEDRPKLPKTGLGTQQIIASARAMLNTLDHIRGDRPY